MAGELKLNDPVLVDSQSSSSAEGGESQQGVVAHLGPVQFAPGSDWIGVRFTGPSAGGGRNDGSVKGVRYFDAGGAKGGVFVKRSYVTKRTLSRLEELRLRRQLGDTSAAGGAGAVSSGRGASSASATSLLTPTPRQLRTPRSFSDTASPKRTPLPRSGAAPAASSSAINSAGGGSGGGGARSRLEEIRARREALVRGRKEGGGASATEAETPPKTPPSRSSIDEGILGKAVTEESTEQTPASASARGDNEDAGAALSGAGINLATATPGYRAELTRLKELIAKLEGELRKKEDESKSLQQSLDFMSKGAEQSTHDAVRMYALGALALTDAKTPVKGGVVPSSKNLEKGLPEEKGGGDSDSEGDDDDEEREEEPEEAIVNQAAAAVSQALVQRNDELTAQVASFTARNADLQGQIDEQEERTGNLSSRLSTLQESLKEEKSKRMDELTRYEADRNVLQSQLSSAERELRAANERISDRAESADSSVVASAKVRAEVMSLSRKHEELQSEKLDLETTLEEVVLDKEQLKEEKEVLEERYEECKIDLESAQLELEECKGELEQRKVEEEQGVVVDMTHAGHGGGEGGGGQGRRSDAEDVARSLSLQNSRLRTALLRLREQSELERNELQRNVKMLERDTREFGDRAAELEEVKSANATLATEAQELKDVVDQTSALEGTIEDLSDKVWNLEELKAECERTIRELEESAEIAAEMEEVQAEEMNLLMRDLEGRNALVRNLEEAIRMQRKREEDFQRYVSEFRSTVSKLKQEKDALLALREGGEGEKSHLLATSQKALAQAAQLVTDAAEARKRDSDAAFARIDARVQSHLSQRLESLLPQGVVASELAAVRGELLLAKVVDKAAVSLTSVEDSFVKVIKNGENASEFNVVEGGDNAVLSDASVQQIAAMIHQAEFANITVEAASDALRLIAVGQWPELLTQESSADLGSVVVHPMAELDMALSEQLRLLKQEGLLSPLRSSLTELDQCMRSTRLTLFDATDEKGKTVVPSEWKPPGWKALKILSLGRFSCLGAAAVLSSALSPLGNSDGEMPAPTLPNLFGALAKAAQSCSAILDVCKKLSGLLLDETEIFESLDELSGHYHAKSTALLECVKTVFAQKSIASEDVDKCTSLLDEVISSISRLGALVRKANLGEFDSNNFHSLSPETRDSWGGVARIVSQVRGVDGDEDDVNFLMRARAIEHQLSEAVQNEPKLLIATAKISSLEKSLSSRSKEISMQNTRISELETFISKSSIQSPGPKNVNSQGSSAPAVETNKLKEEIRVLQEALEVTQKEAEEYEKALKDKSRPSRLRTTGSSRKTPRKSAPGLDLESSILQFGVTSASKSGSAASSRDALLETISLETALFRPVLSASTQSASYWKARAIGSAISNLSPLNIPTCGYSMPSSASEDAKRVLDDALRAASNTGKDCDRNTEELSLARNETRLAKASFTIVDLSKKEKTPRSQLNAQRRRDTAVKFRLKEATYSCLSNKSKENMFPVPVIPSDGNREVWGRVAISRLENVGVKNYVVPLTVNKSELCAFHTHLV